MKLTNFGMKIIESNDVEYVTIYGKKFAVRAKVETDKEANAIMMKDETVALIDITPDGIRIVADMAPTRD